MQGRKHPTRRPSDTPCIANGHALSKPDKAKEELAAAVALESQGQTQNWPQSHQPNCNTLLKKIFKSTAGLVPARHLITLYQGMPLATHAQQGCCGPRCLLLLNG